MLVFIYKLGYDILLITSYQFNLIGIEMLNMIR